MKENQEFQEADQQELSDRAGVGSFVYESEMQRHEGENDIFDKSLKDQMEVADSNHAKNSANGCEQIIPYFELNQDDMKKESRSYNP